MLCGPRYSHLSTILNNIVEPEPGIEQYCSILLTTVNNVGRTTLFNPVVSSTLQQPGRF
jgi:hypothetical protein